MTNENSEIYNAMDDPNAIPVPPSSAASQVTFQGNSYDLMSVVGVTVGAVILFSCATLNFGFYCLPLVPLVLGGIGLASAKNSVDPDRTRLLSWLSLGAGAIIFGLIVLFILLYIILIFFAIVADSGGF